MTVAHGWVTLLSVVQNREGKRSLLIAEGEAVLGAVLHVGNTNNRDRFFMGAKRFMNEWSSAGPAHHCAIGVGHLVGTLECVAQLLKISATRVCWIPITGS